MDASPARGPRLRELGLRIGRLETGAANAVTDVAGVTVGHVTVWRDEADPPEGRGVARTGVTAVVPSASGGIVDPRLAAGTALLNGAGELTGSLQIHEWGLIETPVFLTSTMAVGRVYDGAVAMACDADPSIGVDRVVIPIVGECDDSWLNDARTVQVQRSDAATAVATAAGGPVAEGCVGAGAGMVAFDWKAGIGTSSRRVPSTGATVGVLVLANYGVAANLCIAGIPAGETLGSGMDEPAQPAGSCIALVFTDAPLGAHDLARVARRCGLGLARTGSVAHHGSGEIFLAVSTAPAVESVEAATLDEVFSAVVDATEEAVLNALWAGTDTIGRSGRLVRALPHEPVLELLESHGRLEV
jgi:D-aminopeptidase